MVITERTDITRIEQLERLTNKDTYWEDVTRLCRKVTGKHALERWKTLSEQRYEELCKL